MISLFPSPNTIWRYWVVYDAPPTPREFDFLGLGLIQQFALYYFFIFVVYVLLGAVFPLVYTLSLYPTNLMAQLMSIFTIGIFVSFAALCIAIHWVHGKTAQKICLVAAACVHFVMTVMMYYYAYLLFNIHLLADQDKLLQFIYVAWCINGIGILAWYVHTWFILDREQEKTYNNPPPQYIQTEQPAWWSFIRLLVAVALSTLLMYFQEESNLPMYNTALICFRCLLVVDLIFLIPPPPFHPYMFIIHMIALALVVAAFAASILLIILNFAIVTTSIITFVSLLFFTLSYLFVLHGLGLVHA
jgi:hypothetical protein